MSQDMRKHPAPGGPEVEFFFSANSQYKKGECIPMEINGTKHFVVVGQRNKLPQQALQVLQDAKSRTAVVDNDRYDPSRGGVPRKQEEFYNPEKKFVYQNDFDIEVIKVHE